MDQTGHFPSLLAPPGPFSVTAKGMENFWVVDAAVSYRLPRRYGLISLTVKNLLNNTFRFQDTDPETPGIFPERFLLLNLNLSY